MNDTLETLSTEDVMPSVREQSVIEDDETDLVRNTSDEQSKRCENCEKNSTVYLFSMVFRTAQKPDESRQSQQRIMMWLLAGILFVQVLWAMVLIPCIIFNERVIASASLPFLTLLVTAILGEVVAMAFVVVRFVFRTPISEMLDILKELIHRENQVAQSEKKDSQ